MFGIVSDIISKNGIICGFLSQKEQFGCIAINRTYDHMSVHIDCDGAVFNPKKSNNKKSKNDTKINIKNVKNSDNNKQITEESTKSIDGELINKNKNIDSIPVLKTDWFFIQLQNNLDEDPLSTYLELSGRINKVQDLYADKSEKNKSEKKDKSEKNSKSKKINISDKFNKSINKLNNISTGKDKGIEENDDDYDNNDVATKKNKEKEEVDVVIYEVNPLDSVNPLDLINLLDRVNPLDAVRCTEINPLESREEISYSVSETDIHGSVSTVIVRAEAVSTVQHRVPSGWCSWYHFFEFVSERDLTDNIDSMLSLKAQKGMHAERIGFSLFQVDDGYQRAWGDWLMLHNTRFPSQSMTVIVDKIKGNRILDFYFSE